MFEKPFENGPAEIPGEGEIRPEVRESVAVEKEMTEEEQFAEYMKRLNDNDGFIELTSKDESDLIDEPHPSGGNSSGGETAK